MTTAHNSHLGAAPSRVEITLKNRAFRALWKSVWWIVASWTPPQLHIWRILIIRLFGGQADKTARIYGSARIWDPRNLRVDRHATIGPQVELYSIAPIHVSEGAIISQRATLCTGTHDYSDPVFPLMAAPIEIGEKAWIASEAFVGPGVHVGVGAILGARGVAMKDLVEGTIYVGNPAFEKRKRANR